MGIWRRWETASTGSACRWRVAKMRRLAPHGGGQHHSSSRRRQIPRPCVDQEKRCAFGSKAETRNVCGAGACGRSARDPVTAATARATTATKIDNKQAGKVLWTRRAAAMRTNTRPSVENAHRHRKTTPNCGGEGGRKEASMWSKFVQTRPRKGRNHADCLTRAARRS